MDRNNSSGNALSLICLISIKGKLAAQFLVSPEKTGTA